MDKKRLRYKKVFNILRENKETLKKYKVKKIGVFGSYIRGEQKKNSDLDILVEFDKENFGKNFKGYFDCYMELFFFLENVFKSKIDLLTIEEISPYIKPYIMKEIIYLDEI